MSIKTKIQSRKEKERKPWLSDLYRRFGTPIAPLREPAYLSMDGRGIGTSMNNIGVLRQPNFRVFRVEDAIRQMEQTKQEPLFNPLHQESTTRSQSMNQIVRARPAPKRFGTKKNTPKLETNASNKKNAPKPRPKPKRWGTKKIENHYSKNPRSSR